MLWSDIGHKIGPILVVDDDGEVLTNTSLFV
jgi:hypothetical protein